MSEHIKDNFFKRMILTFCMVLSYRIALADENGNLVIKPYTCSINAISALDFICKAIDMGFGTTPCVKVADNCAQLQQEVFAGLNIEFATAAKWDKWTGFGGAGEVYQTTALCLLRDLNTAPIHTEAAAATPIGNATIKQNVSLLSYDSSSKIVEGVHSAKICVPVGEYPPLDLGGLGEALDSEFAVGVQRRAGDEPVHGVADLLALATVGDAFSCLGHRLSVRCGWRWSFAGQ